MSMRRPAVFGEHDAKRLAQPSDVARRATKAALMADGHLGYVMLIGGVAANRDQVSVVGVGVDIACGSCAIATDLTVGRFAPSEPSSPASEIRSTISFGVGRKNQADDAPVDHPLFEEATWDGVPKAHRVGLREKARAQLGTVGSGYHSADVLADESGRLWVGVHFGSRGFGHTVASGFLSLADEDDPYKD